VPRHWLRYSLPSLPSLPSLVPHDASVWTAHPGAGSSGMLCSRVEGVVRAGRLRRSFHMFMVCGGFWVRHL
jgi:hypothetical protein